MNTYIALLILAGVLTLVGYLWMVIAGFKRSALWGVLVTLFYPLTAIAFAATNWFDARKPFVVYLVSLVMLAGSSWAIYNEVGTRNASQIAERIQNGKLELHEAVGLVTKALNHVGPVDLFAEELQQAGADQTAPQPIAGQLAGSPEAVQAPTELAQAEGPSAVEEPKSNATEKTAVTAQDAAETKADAEPVAEKEAATEAESASDEKAAEKPATPSYPTPDRVQPDPLAQKKKKVEPNTVQVSVNNLSKYIGRYFIITLKNGNTQRGLLLKVEDKTLTINRKLFGGKFEYKIYKDKIKWAHMLKDIPEEK